MSKVPEGVTADALYIASRRVLLDALDALEGQRDALILVGAQAVYLRSQEARLAVAAFTADADLGIDRLRLNDLPRLEEAMRDAGFELSDQPRAQPGQWFRTIRIGDKPVRIPVDLLIPELFSQTARRRRSVNLPPHDRMATRKVEGIELATVDNSVIKIPSLEPAVDPRSADIKVAGVAALLTAKAYKIHDRSDDPNPQRLSNKDAGDVIRLMRTSNPRAVGATFSALLGHSDERICLTAWTGLGYLKDQFGRIRGVGIQMAEQALTGAMPLETIRGLATAYLRELPDGTSADESASV
jgi:hypothetical protein